MTEAVVDRFEVIEVDRQHGDRSRMGRVTLGDQRCVLQECAPIGNAGERVDHGRGTVAQFGAFLRHREQNEGDPKS